MTVTDPLPRTDWTGAVIVREYGCTKCQRYHREGIDAEYRPHLPHQSKHGWRERRATMGERFALDVGALDFSPETR